LAGRTVSIRAPVRERRNCKVRRGAPAASVLPLTGARIGTISPRRCCGAAAAFVGSRARISKPSAPHRFIGNLQATLGEEFLNIAVAPCESEVQPNRVLDHRKREAMPAI
jgi:hypothetical protein